MHLKDWKSCAIMQVSAARSKSCCGSAVHVFCYEDDFYNADTDLFWFSGLIELSEIQFF